MQEKKVSNNGIMNLIEAIVKREVNDYRIALKHKKQLENKKLKLLREHKKLSNDIKSDNCSRTEFMLKHNKLKDERLKLEKSRLENKIKIDRSENWFLSQDGENLCFGANEYILEKVRNEVSE